MTSHNESGSEDDDPIPPLPFFDEEKEGTEIILELVEHSTKSSELKPFAFQGQ